MGEHGVIVDQGAQVGVVDERDLVDFVRRVKAVEEMQERNPRSQRRRVCDGGEVMGAACTLPAASMAHPVPRVCLTSEWSPKIDSACVATVRAATCMTHGVRSPAILNMFGTINNKPCDTVNVVLERDRSVRELRTGSCRARFLWTARR